jgi:hypothetical protein
MSVGVGFQLGGYVVARRSRSLLPLRHVLLGVYRLEPGMEFTFPISA